MPGRPFKLAAPGVLVHKNGVYPRTANTAPTASFDYTPNSPDIKDTVDFTDTSTDDENNISSWSWDFGDGTTSSKQNPSHSYSSQGTYTVSLTVTDDGGLSDSTSQTVSISDAIVDNFEDNDLAEYTVNAGSGTVSTSTARAFNGSYSAELYFNTDQTAHELVSTSGLNAYPAQGDEFEVFWAFDGGTEDRQVFIYFGYQDSNNYYEIRYRNWSSNGIQWNKYVGGSKTNLIDYGSDDITTNDWQRFYVDWRTDGTVDFVFEDASSGTDHTVFTHTDNEFTSGGVGMKMSNGLGANASSGYFDNWRIF